MFKIPWIPGGRRSQGGKFCGLRFSENDRACFLEEPYGCGVIVRDIVGVNGRPHGRLHPRGKENVLESERDAVQWTSVLSITDFRFVLPGGGEGTLTVDGHPGVELRFKLLKAVQTGLDESNGRELLGAQAFGGRGDSERVRLCHADPLRLSISLPPIRQAEPECHPGRAGTYC